MADDAITDEMIREKICQMFLESTKKSKKEYIGIEIEVPIINLNKEAVDFDIVHLVTESFKNHFNSFEYVETEEQLMFIEKFASTLNSDVDEENVW